MDNSETFKPVTAGLEYAQGYSMPEVFVTTSSAVLYRVRKAGKYFIIKTPKDGSGQSLAMLQREYGLSIGRQHPNVVNVFTYEESTVVGPGIAQQQLGNMLRVDRSTIAKWENDTRLPDAAMIALLSDCLGVDVAGLLRLSEKSDETLNVMMVDDEKIILEGGLSVLREVMPQGQVRGFTEPADAIRFAKENKVCLTFVDIEMGKISGLDVCRQLLKIEPHMNVVFLTAVPQYALDAWKTCACGFLEKPLTTEEVWWQLSHLRWPIGGAV